MVRVKIRFYGELNDFLPAGWRMRTVSVKLHSGQMVQDVIESAGIPFRLIDLILVNGRPAEFDRELHSGDRVTCYPEFRSIDISPLNLISRHSIH